MKNTKKSGIVSAVALSLVAILAGGQAQAGNGHRGERENDGSSSHSNSSATSMSHGGSVSNNITGPTTNVGGQTTNVGGQEQQQQQQSSQANNMSTTNNYNNRPMIPGFAAVHMSPSGECGEGWGVSLSGPWSGIGFSNVKQEKEVCLPQRFNSTFVNQGIVLMTNGYEAEGANMIATGMRAQSGISTNFSEAAKVIAANENLDCVQNAKKRPSITTMAQELECGADGRVAIKKPVPVIKADEPVVSY